MTTATATRSNASASANHREKKGPRYHKPQIGAGVAVIVNEPDEEPQIVYGTLVDYTEDVAMVRGSCAFFDGLDDDEVVGFAWWRVLLAQQDGERD